MNKRTISLIGIIVSALFVLFGILAMSGALGGKTYYADTAPYSYDSGYATFGGDYYTYSVNNSAEAASASRAVASNLREISDFLKTFCGTFMAGVGLLGACAFGIIYVGCEKPTITITEPIEEANDTVEAEAENTENSGENTNEEIPEPLTTEEQNTDE